MWHHDLASAHPPCPLPASPTTAPRGPRPFSPGQSEEASPGPCLHLSLTWPKVGLYLVAGYGLFLPPA